MVASLLSCCVSPCIAAGDARAAGSRAMASWWRNETSNVPQPWQRGEPADSGQRGKPCAIPCRKSPCFTIWAWMGREDVLWNGGERLGEDESRGGTGSL